MIKDTSHWIDQTEIATYLLDVRKYNVLSREEELMVLEKIKNGCPESKKKLVHSNLRFVISMAKQYQNQGLDFADLVSEGNYGLLKALDRFDYHQTKVRFLSYAVHWIRQSILQALHEDSRIIRLPVNIINELIELRKEDPKELTDEEIDKLNKYEELPKVIRLDQEIDEDGNSLHDILEDKSVVRMDLNFIDDKTKLLYKLKTALSELNKKELYVITKFYGLDCEQMSLQDISEEMGLTKERVRQIKEKSIKRIRFHSTNLFDLL